MRRATGDGPLGDRPEPILICNRKYGLDFHQILMDACLTRAVLGIGIPRVQLGDGMSEKSSVCSAKRILRPRQFLEGKELGPTALSFELFVGLKSGFEQ